MISQVYEARHDNRIFRIFNNTSRPEALLYVFTNDYTLIPQEPIRLSSFLTFETCKEQALNLFGVPFNTWQESKFKKLEAEHNSYKMAIEEDLPEVGFYLYIFENGKCTHDYLQDSITTCKKQAFEDFGMPLENWVEIN